MRIQSPIIYNGPFKQCEQQENNGNVRLYEVKHFNEEINLTRHYLGGLPPPQI